MRRLAMAKYLVTATYTAEGARGLAKEGGSTRRARVAEMCQQAGGSLEAFYFAFGETDAYSILDLPDAATAAAISLAVTGTGTVRTTVTPLLTVEEIDEAAKRSVTYRPPGG
jgi:uncharacterized protein with GYD domain